MPTSLKKESWLWTTNKIIITSDIFIFFIFYYTSIIFLVPVLAVFTKCYVFLWAKQSLFHYFLFTFHFLERDILFFLSYLDKLTSIIPIDERQADTFVWITTRTTHSMDICYRANFTLVLCGFWVVDNKGYCTNVNTSTNCFRTK